MTAPEQLTLQTAVQTISSFQQRLASLAGDAEAFAARLLPADDGGAPAAVLEASRLARQTLILFASATAPVLAEIGGRGGTAAGGAGGEVTGAGGGGGGATTEAAALLRTPSAPQDQTQGDERGGDRDEPPARKRARVAAGTGARAAAAAVEAAAAAAAQPPRNEAEPRAAALFSSPSSSSETFPSPSSSTSSEDGNDGGESGGGDGAGAGAAGAGGGGQDDGFVFASEPVTKHMLSERTIHFHSSVVRALCLDEGAPDSVQRGRRGAASRKESYRFAVFALRSAPARRGPSSWEPPARDAPGTQACDTDVFSSTYVRKGSGKNYVRRWIEGSTRFFQRRGERGVAGSAREGALGDAEVGDELVFARRGMDRELFIWMEKRAQG